MTDFVLPTKLDRALTSDEDAALRWVLWLEDFPGADELRSQVAHLRATWGRVTELTLEGVDDAPAPVSDGRLPVVALVVGSDDQPEGLISVWVRNGRLALMEYSWFTEQMPMQFPSPDRLRLWDPT